MIGKLPGHNKIDTTAHCVQLARDSIKASLVRVADSIGADIRPVATMFSGRMHGVAGGKRRSPLSEWGFTAYQTSRHSKPAPMCSEDRACPGLRLCKSRPSPGCLAVRPA